MKAKGFCLGVRKSEYFLLVLKVFNASSVKKRLSIDPVAGNLLAL